MKSFFNTIAESVYSPKFYQQIPQKSFKNTFGYFFLLILLLTLLRSVFLFNPLVNNAPKQLRAGIEYLINCYPKGLEIDINQGQATSSAKQPYFLSCDKEKIASESAFLVIDNKTPYSKDQFDKYQVPAWLSKDALVVKSSQYETKSYDLSKVKNFKLDKNIVDSTYKNISRYFIFVGPVLLLISFAMLYLGYVFNLIYLLLFSLVLLTLSTVLKKGFTYPQIFKTGLYAITLPLIIEAILDLTRPWTHFGGLPFMFSLITLGVIFVNLNKEKS